MATSRLLRSWIALLFGIALGPIGCASEEPMVREFLDSGPQPLPVQLHAFSGSRDGYHTTVSAAFRGGADTELRMELEIAIDPQPSLESGRWSYHGPTGQASGTVRPEDLRFAGGQGEGASVGGRFLLHEDGADEPRFVVQLPLRPIENQAYRPEADR